MVAVVGGFFVWRSFAATKLYPYQYSVYQCASFNKDKVPLENKCINESAESLTYRLYEGLTDKAPDSKGYASWTQKLAGDRTKPTDVASAMAANAAINKSANKEFVGSTYVRMHGKKIDAEGQAYWKKQLDAKAWSRGKMLAHWAAQATAKQANQKAFATYLKTAPKVKVVETAVKERDVRLVKSTQAASEAKKQYDSIKGLPAASRAPRDASAKRAQKNPPAAADLQAISGDQKTVQGNVAKAKTALAKIKENEKTTKAFYDRAAEVAAYSPDISAAGIKKQYDTAVKYRKDTESAIAGLNKINSEIAASYKTAEGKYKAEQKRLADIEAAKCKTGTDYNGSADGCGKAPVYSYPSGQNCNYAGGGWSMRTAPIEAYPSRNKYRCVKPGVAAKSAVLTCYSNYEKIVMNDGWTACRLKGTTAR